ncbi:hypothetical protein [Paenibacillus sp. J2TS4]|uniref:hypothetical protein n=1 Tax=Paenibacillus sp. J2TS4 TaxID=2807194 RepID=UPI001B278008|nr:hypothetical protein [Paenibacillus sp. J2TS4]GIP31695.1 hypothetical protein J2TS4_09050 [Paenibacillus sp. J2TS4]
MSKSLKRASASLPKNWNVPNIQAAPLSHSFGHYMYEVEPSKIISELEIKNEEHADD